MHNAHTFADLVKHVGQKEAEKFRTDCHFHFQNLRIEDIGSPDVDLSDWCLHSHIGTEGEFFYWLLDKPGAYRLYATPELKSGDLSPLLVTAVINLRAMKLRAQAPFQPNDHLRGLYARFAESAGLFFESKFQKTGELATFRRLCS